MKRRHYIAVAALIPILLLLRFVADIGDKAPGIYTVIKIIDGDTVELAGRETVRLVGIDTPEHGEPYSEKAKAFLADLILDRRVRIETGYRKRGEYGRLLGYVYIDTLFVNAEILRQGLGHIYLFPDNRHADSIMEALFTAQHEAMAAGVGIWSLPPYMEEEYYIGNLPNMRFHRQQCPAAKSIPDNHMIIFKTREEAFHEGYSPCRNCKP